MEPIRKVRRVEEKDNASPNWVEASTSKGTTSAASPSPFPVLVTAEHPSKNQTVTPSTRFSRMPTEMKGIYPSRVASDTDRLIAALPAPLRSQYHTAGILHQSQPSKFAQKHQSQRLQVQQPPQQQPQQPPHQQEQSSTLMEDRVAPNNLPTQQSSGHFEKSEAIPINTPSQQLEESTAPGGQFGESSRDSCSFGSNIDSKDASNNANNNNASNNASNGESKFIKWNESNKHFNSNSSRRDRADFPQILREIARQACEARLYRLLLRLSPESRRTIIHRKLSEEERKALEKWILKDTLSRGQGKNPSLLAAKRESKRRNSAAHAASKASHRKTVAKQFFRTSPGSQAQLRRRSSSIKSGIPGVYVRVKSGRIAYTTSIQVKSIKVDVPHHTDLQTVLKYKQVLMSIRRKLLVIMRPSCWLDAGPRETAARVAHQEDMVRQILLNEPERFGLEVSTMRLRLSIAVSTKYWIGANLRTPSFPLPHGLDAAMKAWSRLEAARSLVHRGRANRNSFLLRHTPKEMDFAWHHIKTVYLHICEKAGFPTLRTSSRLRQLEERHRERISKDCRRQAARQQVFSPESPPSNPDSTPLLTPLTSPPVTPPSPALLSLRLEPHQDLEQEKQ